jgi:hypothetical protein
MYYPGTDTKFYKYGNEKYLSLTGDETNIYGYYPM